MERRFHKVVNVNEMQFGFLFVNRTVGSVFILKRW